MTGSPETLLLIRDLSLCAFDEALVTAAFYLGGCDLKSIYDVPTLSRHGPHRTVGRIKLAAQNL